MIISPRPGTAGSLHRRGAYFPCSLSYIRIFWRIILPTPIHSSTERSLKYIDWRLNHHFNNTRKRITEWLSCLKTSNTFAIFQLCISKQGLMFYSPLICCIQYQLVSVPALAWCLIFYPLHKPDIFIEVQSFNISVQNIKCFNYGGGLVFWDKIFILPKINTKILSVQPPLRKYLNPMPMDGIELRIYIL